MLKRFCKILSAVIIVNTLGINTSVANADIPKGSKIEYDVIERSKEKYRLKYKDKALWMDAFNFTDLEPDITKLSTIDLIDSIINLQPLERDLEGTEKSTNGELLSNFLNKNARYLLKSVTNIDDPTETNWDKGELKSTKPLDKVVDLTYFTDYLMVRLIDQFSKECKNYNLKDMDTVTNQLKRLNTSRWYSKPFMDYLKDKYKIDNMEKYVKYFYDKKFEIEGEASDQVSSSIIATKYLKPILNDSYLESNESDYNKYKAILYSLTSADGDNDKLKYKTLQYIGSDSSEKEQFVPISSDGDYRNSLEGVLNATMNSFMEASFISENEKVQLYSIVAQQGSKFSLDTNKSVKIPFKYASTLVKNITDENASTNAQESMKKAEGLISMYGNDSLGQENRRMLSINYRMSYYYYLSKTSKPLESNTIDSLTNNEKSIRSIEPCKPEEKIVNVTMYTRFMDTLNEISYTREVIVKALGDLTADTQTTNDLIRNVAYLHQLKSAVVFLESIHGSGYKQAIDLWYEQIDTPKGKRSLEDIYQLTVSMGIKVDNFTQYAEDSETEPLRKFFNLKDKSISDYLKIGISNSATYLPFRSNVYDISTYKLINNNSFYEFHSKYGYNRKALMIDTNINSSVDYYTTGRTGNLKVVTLRDILNCDRDISLYLDDNFYNINKLADLKNLAYDKMTNGGENYTDKGFLGNVWTKAKELFNTNIEDIVKTGNKDKYTNNLKGITQYKESKNENFKKIESNKDKAVLDGNAIDEFIDQEDYNVMKSFAFVSSVYRSTKLQEYLNNTKQEPVFVSSKDLPLATGANIRDRSSIFNYTLLKNSKGDIPVGYVTNIDMDNPLYMDIYGNIVTESGLVVIPSASNATIQKSYSPYTAGFLANYGKSYKIDDKYEKSLAELTDIFNLDEKAKSYNLADKSVNNFVDLNRLSIASDDTLNTLYSLYRYQFKGESFDVDIYVRNILMEVLRGAPIEYIDKEFENLNTNMKLSKFGISQAMKLDNLKSTLSTKSQNAILAIPNLAFIDGVEYIILFAYKVALVISLLMIIILIFSDAMRQKFSYVTIWKLIMVLVLTLVTIYTIPAIFNYTYYGSNKLLLQSESEYISMLNLEKSESGVEIGTTSVEAPNLTTQLYMKVADIDIPWYELASKIIYSPIDSNLSKIYQSAYDSNVIVGQKDFTLRNGKVYLAVDDLYKSSSVVFDSRFRTLYQYTDKDIPASFYTPYYAFLDNIIGKVNYFNNNTNTFSYSMSLYKGGTPKSLGLIKEYLTGDDFISENNRDIFNISQIYNLPVLEYKDSVYPPEEIERIKKSQWVDLNFEEKDILNRIDKMDKRAKSFVLKNKDLLGKISDETFLKVMTLDCAMYYNKLFNIRSCDSLEIYNLSTDDLSRLSVATRDIVMKNSPLSYTRFIYEQEGVVGIYLAAIQELVYFLVSWIKPLVTLIMFAVLFLSIFIEKILLRREDDDSVKGYLKTTVLLCCINFLYSILLKGSLYLPSIGLKTGLCLFIQIIFHLIFLIYFGFLAVLSIKNWKDLGNQRYNDLKSFLKDTFTGDRIERDKDIKSREGKTEGWRRYKQLRESNEYRKYNIIKNKEI